ncbi:hypothetical protein Tco_0337407 [Tanacetum coccineum]
MLVHKGSTYNGRPKFSNPMYLKKAQSEKPCLYEIPYDQSDLANIFAPNREETLTLEQESRSKLNKDLVRIYQKSQENHHKQVNTDTRTEERAKARSQSQKKLTSSQPWSTEVKDKPQNIPIQSLKFPNVTQMVPKV